jgi:SAM-dependent methyltransferase
MGPLAKWLENRFYADYRENWDDTLFRDHILAELRPDSVILDLGAGAGIVAQMNFRGIVTKVCGVDLDERVLDNPYLDEAKLADAGKIPFPDSTFDLVFADNVFEHLDDPAAVLRECVRVLKPSGALMFKTPNKNHYMPLVARLTPHRFHAYVNRIRGRHETDTFPTRYRANSPAAVRRLAAGAGLRLERLELVEGRPEYLRMSFPTYLVGAAYERLVNRFETLAGLRILLIACLRKP